MKRETAQTGRKRAVFLLLMVVGAGIVFGTFTVFQHRQESRRDKFAEQSALAQKTRNWTLLRETATEWRSWDPDSGDALIFLADAAQQSGDFADAEMHLLQVLETDERALPAYVAAMKLQFGPLNQPLKGVSTANRILEIEPRTVDAHSGLIEFYVVTLQHDLLLKQLRNTIKFESESPAAYAYLFLVDTLRVGNASEMNSAWLISAPDEELFLVAEALHLPEPGAGAEVQNKYEVVDALLGRFPQNTELLAYQIDLNIRKGDVNEVIRLLKRVSGDVDRDHRFWRFKGWTLLMRNQLPEAEQALRQALALHPMDWDARNWLADLVRRQGNAKTVNELAELVRQARQIRESINAQNSVQNLPREILSQLEEHARKCGDVQVANALRNRLSK